MEILKLFMLIAASNEMSCLSKRMLSTESFYCRMSYELRHVLITRKVGDDWKLSDFHRHIKPCCSV